ncbi:hypothetical protein BaRGS_00022141 [Batillaria attramentaria]|uniref:Uncharacterized protein n=1 Tax=Batillaria attramentaria TaxID=370345 RepID=A0ABD0KHR0_9CAEN
MVFSASSPSQCRLHLQVPCVKQVPGLAGCGRRSGVLPIHLHEDESAFTKKTEISVSSRAAYPPERLPVPTSLTTKASRLDCSVFYA